mmetsp:Transcript_29340/g.75647  ORF Transcript_29340/g.75647 Transcript_29340/m.75647 type:complete len:220 (+) Transcript_29340:2681-3340(+)
MVEDPRPAPLGAREDILVRASSIGIDGAGQLARRDLTKEAVQGLDECDSLRLRDLLPLEERLHRGNERRKGRQAAKRAEELRAGRRHAFSHDPEGAVKGGLACDSLLNDWLIQAGREIGAPARQQLRGRRWRDGDVDRRLPLHSFRTESDVIVAQSGGVDREPLLADRPPLLALDLHLESEDRVVELDEDDEGAVATNEELHTSDPRVRCARRLVDGDP